MGKTEVYSWRLDPDLKQRLGAAARDEKASIGELLDRIVREWLETHQPADDEAEQRRLHEAAEEWIGSISLGKGPYTRERIRERVRARLTEKRKRWHRDAPPRSD